MSHDSRSRRRIRSLTRTGVHRLGDAYEHTSELVCCLLGFLREKYGLDMNVHTRIAGASPDVTSAPRTRWGRPGCGIARRPGGLSGAPAVRHAPGSCGRAPYSSDTNRALNVRVGVESRTKNTPGRTAFPCSSRPSQALLCSPAGSVPLASVRTRRPETS